MEKSIKINYFYRRTDNPDHHSELEEHALEHILEMNAEGYSSGELYCTIDDHEYSGGWSIKFSDP